jgi:DNA processing protein
VRREVRDRPRLPLEADASVPRGWPEGFVSEPADREALLLLAHLDGLTPRRLHSLAWHVGSARGCLAAVRAGGTGSASDRAQSAEIVPDRVRAALVRCGARHVFPGDDDYPMGLLDLPDPPASLFVRGKSLLTLGPTLAMVGARRCSQYGREVAEMIGRGVAAAAVTVVSGAALGIDAASHKGALSVGSGLASEDRRRGPGFPAFPTLAVLGSGIDRPHPQRNRALIEEIAAVGAVVSEYPPGVPALPWRFPARNRLVAALSRAVVVVEGAAGSGSMITAEFALEMGRDVLAVPGAVTSPLAAVPHQLLREGACLVRGAQDVLEVLGLEPVAPPLGDAAGWADDSLPSAERRALEEVTGSPVTVDAVAAGARMNVEEALSALVALELRGIVREVAGRYERTAATAR